MSSAHKIIREFVREALREDKRRKKPGGPRTDIGALKQLYPDTFAVKVRAAVKGEKGDVKDAADRLDVAPRTLYHYLETEPSLSRVKTTQDLEDEKDKKE